MDTRKLLEMLTKNPVAGAAAGGLAGTLLGNVLMGGSGKGGRKLVKYGGLAAVGYVAYQAYQKHQAQKKGALSGVPTGVSGTGSTGLAGALESLLGGGAKAPALPQSFDLEAAANTGNALRVVQAMIAASKADGILEPEERERIFIRVNESGLSAPERAQVEQLLEQPADLESVVRGVNTKELATEIYAASLLAISPASRAERAYLDMLAARLNLEPDLMLELDRSVGELLKV